jgi:predicted nucleotidyltransferase
MSNLNIEMIQNVAKALGDLNNQVVFVGGATVCLYLDLNVAPEVRPTEDVDVVIEITSMAKYQRLSEKLLKMKFTQDQTVGAPICRWKYLGIIIDIMPLDENILGFSNKYYKEGFKFKEFFHLPDGQEIQILPIGWFLATKIQAYYSRGVNDPRFSKDLEDIVAIFSDGKDLESISKSVGVVSYIKGSLTKIFNDPVSAEAIRGFIPGSVKEQFELIKQSVSSL